MQSLTRRKTPSLPTIKHKPRIQCPRGLARNHLHRTFCLQSSTSSLPEHPYVISRKNTALSTIRHHSQSTTQQTYVDPNRPDLFYHLVSPPTRLSRNQPSYALSFLESRPKTTDSPTVIGWIPTEASPDRAMQQFVPNPKFVGVMQKSILAGLGEGVDDIWINGALQLQQGWMHIHDQRNVPPLGRIGDPDDIIGSVLVQESKILPETYYPMPSHRLCTADGVVQLTPGLSSRLHKALLEVANEEAASS